MNILISPLNWGIGHATRLVPLIRLLEKKHKIFLAADGKPKSFLEQEFPHLTILPAPIFEISYTKKASALALKMFISIPKLIIYYFRNKKFVKKIISKEKIDLIISDNRFGFFSKKIKSVFITHQIHIKTTKNLRILKKAIFYLNKKNIEKFDELWIPDDPKINISGNLSSTKGINIPHKYIGLLSRFEQSKLSNAENNYKVISIISGPEPQRSLLRKKIISELLQTQFLSLILDGKPDEYYDLNKKNIRIISHLETEQMQKILSNSEIIIARAGYSTIMDLIKLKKTAILIPTPRQTEQEYLANYLHNNSLFYYVEQKNFSLKDITTFKNRKEQLQSNIKSLKTSINLNDLMRKIITTK